MEKKKRITIFLLLALALFLPAFSHAEFLTIENLITLETNPKNPASKQEVTASLESYSTDLTRATITWKKDGVVVSSGIGKKSLPFTTGTVAKTLTLIATIKTAEGAFVTKTLNIRASEVDLVLQANSHTPPFYKGKALFPPQGNSIVAAIPNLFDQRGNKISSDNLIYKWKKDYVPEGSVSGYGKDTYTFNGPIIVRPVLISVEVSSADNAETANNSILIEPSNPYVLFYENNPIYGVRYEKALGREASLFKDETTITTVPYFFNSKVVDGGLLSFSWNMNGEQIAGSKDGREITLRQEGASGGTSEIFLETSNPNQILQFSTTNLKLNFFKPKSSSFAQ